MQRILSAMVMIVMLIALSIQADANQLEGVTRVRCTCYTIDGITASGQHTRQGIVAGKSEWLGCVAVLYDTNGEFIGFYEVLDTGGTNAIRSGKTIDVWVEDDEAVREWQRKFGDYVYIQIIEAEG